MSKTRVEFHPVIPNITDDSMREGDADTEIIHARNQQRTRATGGGKPPVGGGKPPVGGGKPPAGQIEDNFLDTDGSCDGNGNGESDSSTWVRRGLIAVMVVVIVVLVILLIYQVYCYYTSDKYDNTPTVGKTELVKPLASVCSPPIAAKAGEESAARVFTHEDPDTSFGIIPSNVRNLDNNVLRQYIEKGSNSTVQRTVIDSRVLLRPRVVNHTNLANDTATICEIDNEDEGEDELRSGELECISDILAGGRDNSGEDPPSHEDAVGELTREMDEERDAASAAAARSTARESDGDIISDFEGEQTGGCGFTARTGKNRGSVCGKRLVTTTRCSAHRGR